MRKIESSRILAVEGKDECNFFNALITYENLSEIQIIDIGGKDKFKKEFSALINIEGFSDIVNTLGFVRDAEENKADSAFNSICDILKKNKLPAPKEINSIINIQGKKIGIFIMPNNIDKGMLEDLCLTSISETPVYECIEQYIGCCKRLNEKEFNISKAKCQTYLSIQNPPASSLGVGALKNYWDFRHNCFFDIKNFLHNLFD